MAGEELLRRRLPDKAVEFYERALANDKSKAIYHLRLGVAYFRSQRYERAREVFGTALKQFPDNANFYFLLGYAARAEGRYDEAVTAFNQALKLQPENPDVMYDSGRDVWAPEFRKRQPNVSMETIEKYLHNLYRVRPDFVHSVSRDFVRSCQTPMLVLPDDTPAHAYQTAVDVASLAPNAEVSVYPWKEPAELKARTINRARTFLKRQQPSTAAR